MSFPLSRRVGWHLMPRSLRPMHGRAPLGTVVYASRDEAVQASERALAVRAEEQRQLAAERQQLLQAEAAGEPVAGDGESDGPVQDSEPTPDPVPDPVPEPEAKPKPAKATAKKAAAPKAKDGGEG